MQSGILKTDYVKSINVKVYFIATICTIMHKNGKSVIKDINSIRTESILKTAKGVVVWMQVTFE